MSSKSRWRGKIFQSEEYTAEKAQRKQAMEQDVLDFLKPSIDKASPKAPRIDVAAAQRWPAAASLLSKVNSSQNPSSTLPSSMRGADRPSRARAKTLTVGFLNKEPDIIGEGGDESETPPIEISRRRVVAARAAKEGRKLDEGDLGRSLTVSHKLERPEIKKGHASWSQLSPGLEKRFSRPRSPPPQAPPEPEVDDDAATKLQLQLQLQPQHHSQDSTLRAKPDFRPGPLKRTQTGISEMMPESPEDTDFPRLPELQKVASADSYTALHDELQNYLSAEPDARDSLSARVQHQMRIDEGQALRRGSAHQPEPPVEDAILASGSSSSTLEMGSPQSMSSNSYGRPSYDQGGHLVKATHMPNPFDDPTVRRPSSASSNTIHSRAASSTSPIVPVSSSQRDFGPSPLSSPHSHLQPGLAPRPPPHGYFDSTVPTPTQHDFDRSVKSAPEHFVLGEDLPDMRSPALNVEIPKQPPRQQHLVERTPWSTTSSGHRSDLVAAGDAAFEDFGDRVAHMKGVFRLTAEVKKPMTQYTPMQWIRAASWWFLRGRAGLEIMIRNRPRGQPMHEEQLLTQAHVDLAKAWWILTEVIDTHPGVKAYGTSPSRAEAARAAGDADMGDVFENQEAALGSLKGLLVSVARNGVMPPTNALIQGQDQSIWVDYPTFSPDAETVLSGQSRSIVMDASRRSINPRTVMPLSDTKEDFCYGRIFVQVGVMIEGEGDDDDKISVPCVLTIMRQPNDWTVKVGICSQTELLTACIQSDGKKGVTWDNVRWKTRERGLLVRLPRGFTLSLDLSEKDYRMLWGIWDYTRTVAASLKPRPDEELLHEVTLRDLQYKDPENAAAFPPDRVKRSMVRVFEKLLTLNEGTGERKLHRGYRILMVTSPRNKTLSSVSHEFNGTRPLVFEFRADPVDQNVPLMILRIKEDKRKTCTASLAFHEIKERVQLFQVLNGLRVGPDEVCAAQVPMTAFNIEQLGMKEVYSQGHDIVKKLQWQDVKVMDGAPEEEEEEGGEQFKILSEQLRIVARHTCGSITDRLNLGPGEMLVRLDNSGGPHIHMLRLPQDDANAAIDCKRAEPNVPEAISEFLRTLKASATIRSYSFPNHEALHKFQLAVTGFQVKYDGVASTLAISRRRMVVPIYKRWEACTVRIQIVQQANVTQLLAFMEDFSHADAMNFQLKSMDVFEIVELKGSKGEKGRFGLRLVDAKFYLPKERRKDDAPVSEVDAAKRRFACLDMPEYAGEHDDITLGFETEAERERFASVLPAATQLARLISFKRKI